MKNTTDYTTLRVFISSTDRYKQQPLYETIVFEAKKFGIAGATVLKGIMGYGASSEIYNQNFWELSEKIPLVIEIVDEAVKVDAFVEILLPIIQSVPKGCLITEQKTAIVVSKKGEKQ
ncbi:MAG: DUF190 domain-containing protein [Paludibacteraceae bacterium]|nr:DUF190 domain-containing protein [Paludibacteraceae bacterium]